MKRMKKTQLIKTTLTAWVALACSACATQAPRHDASLSQRKPLASVPSDSESSVDIDYILGHSRRRFMAWSKPDACGGQTSMDQQVIKDEDKIDRDRYAEFIAKVERFVEGQKRGPAAKVSGDCRTPFTVTLRRSSDVRKLQGCRGTDDGNLSRLVRDGEFLLHSAQD